MLDTIALEQFEPLIGKACRVRTPAGELIEVSVDAVKAHPKTQSPYAPKTQRIPFSVALTALEPTAFEQGSCDLELSGTGASLSAVWIARMAALGRDPARAYFQIIFN